jgi:hypothetical protein
MGDADEHLGGEADVDDGVNGRAPPEAHMRPPPARARLIATSGRACSAALLQSPQMKLVDTWRRAARRAQPPCGWARAGCGVRCVALCALHVNGRAALPPDVRAGKKCCSARRDPGRERRGGAGRRPVGARQRHQRKGEEGCAPRRRCCGQPPRHRPLRGRCAVGAAGRAAAQAARRARPRR